MVHSCLPTLAVLASVALASAAPALKETFDGTWEKRWLKSSWKESEGSAGDFTLSAGKWYGDAEADKGIQTGPDARFFTRYTELAKPFDNAGKDLVIQFSVKNEQKLDCGGGYIKLIPDSVSAKDMEAFGGDTPYAIMFGPDICGFSTKRVHVIFTYKGKNHLIKKDIPCETDEITHVYTLVVRPDNTYEVFIDTESKAKGSLFEDWDMLPPRKIKDPDAKKPEDWDDRAKIEDPDDVKPEGYDDIPETISDPDAKKPDDWDDEDDGEWEPPTIPNPEYKGEWKPKMIDNPAYKGTWEAPEIDNPDFTDDPDLYKRGPIKYVGFELWQVKSGTIFDNIMLTDNLEEALAFAKDTWGKSIEAEKEMKKSVEEAEKAAEDAAKSSDSTDDADDDADDDDEDDEDEDLKEEL